MRVALQEILGEGLRAFELRRGLRGPKQRSPAASNVSHEADDQRRLGADDGQVDLFPLREGEQGGDVVGGDVDVGRVRLEPRAGVARRDEDLRHARRLRDLPGQCVFATAGTDDQDFHEGMDGIGRIGVRG